MTEPNLPTPTTELQALLPRPPDAHARAGAAVRVRAVAHVARLAEIIVSGQWDTEYGSSSSNGAILFTPNLQVGNGQHRLAAVDLADWPITVYVERCQWGPWQGPPLGAPG